MLKLQRIIPKFIKHSGFYFVIVDFKCHKIKEILKNLKQLMLDEFDFVRVL